MLEINKVTKIYKTTGFTQKALDEVSVKFRKNEFVSILGPSGSGKTTLLNIIGGLDHYTSGDLIINGVSTKKYKDADWDNYRNRSIGFVFQSYNLIPHQTILANVELALTLTGVSKRTRTKKAKEVLKKVGLEKHIHKKPTELSGGQMQRVAIARALINDPDILLADEPTGALDTKTSIQIMDILKEVAETKLVIMVTHNPDLANKYSNRIVSLQDGVITDDTNPYDGESEEKQDKPKRKVHMSFKTALSLSLNNLMTKKGRTLLTAFAGSIGIIGIALIMSLSNGISNYISKVEEETLSSYPITLESEQMDTSSIISSLTGNSEKKEYNDDKIHSVNIMGDMLTTISSTVKKNDLKTFKEYLETEGKDINNYVTDIQYSYNQTLNLYKNDDTMTQVNPTTVLDSVGMASSGMSSAYSSYMSSYDVFTEMISNDELLKKQYDIVAGHMPENYNEMVLIVDENNQISDYTLYSLGLLDQTELANKFNQMLNGEQIEFEETSYAPNDLLNITYKLVLESDYYKKVNGIWVNMSNDSKYMKNVINNAIDVKIVGIIKPSEESVGASSSGLVGYTHELVEYMINKNNNSKVVQEQLNNKDTNVLTGLSFNKDDIDYSSLTDEEIAALATSTLTTQTYDSVLSELGYADLSSPSSINIYPKDFDSKQEIENIIDKYNEGKDETDQISYTDIVGTMMSSVTTIINAVSGVLIAFVAISLIVSSIMIAIITYISVIERTKEIGILRAIGASKKDISRVFNAETLIEGAASGILGILVTLLLIIPINSVIKNVVDISNLAELPIKGAIILILISIILTVIAGLIPARIASKKDPVEALRTE